MEVLDLTLRNPVLQSLLSGGVMCGNDFCSHEAPWHTVILINAVLPLMPLYK